MVTVWGFLKQKRTKYVPIQRFRRSITFISQGQAVEFALRFQRRFGRSNYHGIDQILREDKKWMEYIVNVSVFKPKESNGN